MPPAGPRRIMQHPTHAERQVTAPPVVNVIATQRQSHRNMRRAHVIGQQQQNARAYRQFLRRVPIRDDVRELRPIGRRKHDTVLGCKHAQPYRSAA